MVHFSYFKRVLCVFLALALVFCMVTFPVAASSALALTATAILASVAAGALIKALGLLVDYASDGWDTLVSDITRRWTERGYMQDGNVQAVTDGENVYFSEDLIQDTRDYMWESGLLTAVENGAVVKVGAGQAYKVGVFGIRCTVDYFCFILRTYPDNDVGYAVGFTTDPLAEFHQGYYSFTNSATVLPRKEVVIDGVTYYYAKYAVSGISDDVPYYGLSEEALLIAYVTGEIDCSDSITVPDGYEAGYIAGREAGLAEGYVQWAENSVADDTTVYYPVYVGTQEEIADKTQEEMWAGGTSMEMEEEVSVGSLSDFLAALKSFLATKFAAVTTAVTSVTTWLSDILTAVTSIPAAIADFFTPSAELDTYTIGLRDFFPFCIPFDIYDMLNAFRADPVTPRWDLEFDFGELGTFPFTVDFAPWDELAQIVRTFEVVLFCVGLAAASKKLLGW